jgi:hypothetical protein
MGSMGITALSFNVSNTMVVRVERTVWIAPNVSRSRRPRASVSFVRTLTRKQSSPAM